jgi:hypothetical protein
MRLALEGQIFRMGNNLQVVRVPAGVDTTAMMQLSVHWDRAAENLPAEAVGVAVLCLGHAAVRGAGPGEQPAGSQLPMGRSEDRVIEQALQLRPTALRRPPGRDPGEVWFTSVMSVPLCGSGRFRRNL